MNDDRKSMIRIVEESGMIGPMVPVMREMARRLDKLFITRTPLQEEADRLRDKINGRRGECATLYGSRVDWTDPDQSLLAGYHYGLEFLREGKI